MCTKRVQKVRAQKEEVKVAQASLPAHPLHAVYGRVYVGPELRTGTVCKLGHTVYKLGASGIQFVDCTRLKLDLQTGHFGNAVCKREFYDLQTARCAKTHGS